MKSMFDHLFSCTYCIECPFYDDSAGFSWCIWYHSRCDHRAKPKFCGITKVSVEENKDVD
jgi:hypothetical protein